jgi:anti-sigma regulatory factor (Ser/Thr protein kinase)
MRTIVAKAAPLNKTDMLLRFVATVDQISDARKATAETLTAWGLPGLADDAELIVSELLTNALLHAGGTAVMVLTREDDDEGDGIVVGVWDRSPDMPMPKRPDRLAEKGRGLHLVAALSSKHDHYPSESGGKVVWALVKSGN